MADSNRQMKFTPAEISHIHKLCDTVVRGSIKEVEGKEHRVGGYTNNSDLSLQRFAIMHLADLIYPHYIEFIKSTNEILFKYIETENGVPKKKVKILLNQNKSPEPHINVPENDFVWKGKDSEENYNKEIDTYMSLKEIIVDNYKKYPIEKLLETKIKVQDTQIYQLLKYIME